MIFIKLWDLLKSFFIIFLKFAIVFFMGVVFITIALLFDDFVIAYIKYAVVFGVFVFVVMALENYMDLAERFFVKDIIALKTDSIASLLKKLFKWFVISITCLVSSKYIRYKFPLYFK